MKRFAIGLVAVALLFSVQARGALEPLPYTEGSVWVVTFVKVKPGFSDDYLRSLSQTWKKMFDEAKKQKLVLSYKVLSGFPATRDDWELMLMIEYKNLAALDGLHEKMRAIVLPMLGGEDKARELQTKRLEVREMIGEKIARELIFK